ncbi:MAG TPA: hypothetical protein VMT16_08390 [Thermoanaerobaculia bacterium]|nr:hypothetical protein [Thermoanaerobaculia bacterium]
MLAVLAAVLATLWAQWHSPQRRILRRLAALEEALEKDGPEDQLATLGRGREITRFFAPGFLILAAPYEGRISSPQELVGAVHRLRSAGTTVAVDFRDVEIEVRRANDTADMGLEATVAIDLGDGEGRESYRGRLQWVEEEGQWLIQQVEILEVLEGGRRLF